MVHVTPGTSIRILAKANNERGDLFTRLARDLFFTLGYDELELDVALSGREIDIQGQHRSEPRRLVAECKAHADAIGGADLNKFLGVLTREQKKYRPRVVAGYFVSLTGFTGTGVQQEREAGDEGIILFDAGRVIDELQRSRVVVPVADATEKAGQCAQVRCVTSAQLDGTDLLLHQGGYAWAVYYSHGKERTHFALVHADGTLLAQRIAEQVVEADRGTGGSLHLLTYLAPPPPPADAATNRTLALTRYHAWLAEDCGYIQLDGLPADAELSATRLKLEKLFVPLRAHLVRDAGNASDVTDKAPPQSVPIGEMLVDHPHLALLAAPGGGKSTLLKSLAIAYAFPDRRSAISKDLPDREWMPLLLRCRELRQRAHRPIVELLGDLCVHAGMSETESISFQSALHDALNVTGALLLVDGLDEISDEGARVTFTKHLRTFLATFPKVKLLVTSREAGFRIVAAVIAGACVRAKVAPLEKHDVEKLCVRWHVEVLGDNEKVRGDASSLADDIWGESRIRALADNPLLLTTLLVVRRWIGELPRSRAALYREAVRVLIRTWNVEGYDPLDEEETLAQLSYLACSMLEEGTPQISHKALLRNLQLARNELEAELQFTRVSPEQFIERIEYRSSLLIQVGHTRVDDALQAVYEFRHLTFQEYLAARGFVEEQYPGRDSGRNLASILSPHFWNESWREVISLAAVLAGRRAEETIKSLIAACQRVDVDNTDPKASRNPVMALRTCLLDEVQLTAPTLRLGLRQIAMERSQFFDERITRGKFGTVFKEVVEAAYLPGDADWDAFYSAFSEVVAGSVGYHDEMTKERADVLLIELESSDRVSRIGAAFRCVNFAFASAPRSDVLLTDSPKSPLTQKEHENRARLFEPLRKSLINMLDPADWPSALPAAWALAWIGDGQLFTTPPAPADLLSMFRLWRDAAAGELGRFAAWSLSAQPLLPRDTFTTEQWGDCDNFLKLAISRTDHSGMSARNAALVVTWYRRRPLDDTALVHELDKIDQKGVPPSRVLREILVALGAVGTTVLARWDKAEAERRSKAEGKTDAEIIVPPSA